MVLTTTEKTLPREDNADEEEAEADADVGIMEEIAEFDHVVLWGHEALPDELVDPFVRGLGEWIEFAEKVCVIGEVRNGFDAVLS